MGWIWVALVIALLGVIAAVAVGRGDPMARAFPDRRDVRLPAGRLLTAEDLEDVEFSVTLRGYRMDEVDELLRRLSRELAARDGAGELPPPAGGSHRGPAKAELPADEPGGAGEDGGPHEAEGAGGQW